MMMVATAAIDEITKDVLKGISVGVCDSSFNNEFGIVSWILEYSSGIQRIIISGFKTDQSAYRGEIGGIYGLVMAMELINIRGDSKRE